MCVKGKAESILLEGNIFFSVVRNRGNHWKKTLAHQEMLWHFPASRTLSSLWREHFQYINTKEKGRVRRPSVVQLEQRIQLRTHFSFQLTPIPTNPQLSQVLTCACAHHGTDGKPHHPNQVIFFACSKEVFTHRACSRIQRALQSGEVRDLQAGLFQLQPWSTSLMAQPNYVTVTTLPCGCSAT